MGMIVDKCGILRTQDTDLGRLVINPVVAEIESMITIYGKLYLYDRLPHKLSDYYNLYDEFLSINNSYISKEEEKT